MIGKKLIGAMLVMIAVFAVSVTALPVDVLEVELDEDTLDPYGANSVRAIDRDNEFDGGGLAGYIAKVSLHQCLSGIFNRILEHADADLRFSDQIVIAAQFHEVTPCEFHGRQL